MQIETFFVVEDAWSVRISIVHSHELMIYPPDSGILISLSLSLSVLKQLITAETGPHFAARKVWIWDV